MWTRKELKTKAKAAFKANYWLCVLVALILTVLVGGTAAYTGNHVKNSASGYSGKVEDKVNKDTADILKQTFKSKEITINGKTIAFDNNFTVAKITEALNEASSAISGGKLNINGKDIDLSKPEDVKELQEFTDKLKDTLSSVSGYSDSEVAEIAAAVLIGIVTVITVIMLISMLLKIFIFNPLAMGGASFFLRNSREKAPFSEMGRGFSPKYGRNIGSLFLTNLFVALWSLLFIIPGIVKSYSYRMVPYILAENPDIKATEAITMSRKMMNGNKWKSFVLDLSFIGWHLLSGITFGLLGIFYVYPYVYSTDAQLYEAIKNV